MHARNGKIARLPAAVREELNLRLEQSEESPDLLQWLNALPEVQEILTQHFDGVPISPQNLSQWRLGGFQEWLLRRQFGDQTMAVSELGLEMDPASSRRQVADHAATALAARFGILLAHWNGEVDEKIQATGKFLTGLCPSVVRLQKAAHEAVLNRFEEQRQREDEKSRENQRTRSKFITAMYAQQYGQKMASECGGSEQARTYGEIEMEILLSDFDGPIESLQRYMRKKAAAAEQAKTEASDKSITVNQSNFSPSKPAVEPPPPSEPSPVAAPTLPPDPEVAEFERIAKEAQTGDPLTEYQLGARYRDGLGCAKNLDKAEFWLEKAARAGVSGAKLGLNALRLRSIAAL